MRILGNLFNKLFHSGGATALPPAVSVATSAAPGPNQPAIAAAPGSAPAHLKD